MRLIDADELKKAIKTDIMGGLNYERFIDIAPTVNQWIPVEDLLPEEKPVLISFKELDSDTRFADGVEIAILSMDWNTHELYWHTRTTDFDMDEVIAWQQLPERYKGES